MTAIRWAKAQGYRYYDLEGIDPHLARAVVAGAPAPDRTGGESIFKLSYTEERVTLFPQAYNDVAPQPLR